MHISFLKKKKKKKKKGQLICGNDIFEIEGGKLWEWICGNGIVEIEGKKNCGNEFVAMASPK